MNISSVLVLHSTKGILFHHWKVPCYFKYNSTFPKTFCRSVSYKYWHIQAMYPPTEQVEDHSQINFSVLLFQRKWISASSAFQCSPSSKLARCSEESDFCDNQKHGPTAFSWGVLNTLVQKEATLFSKGEKLQLPIHPSFLAYGWTFSDQMQCCSSLSWTLEYFLPVIAKKKRKQNQKIKPKKYLLTALIHLIEWCHPHQAWCETQIKPLLHNKCCFLC